MSKGTLVPHLTQRTRDRVPHPETLDREGGKQGVCGCQLPKHLQSIKTSQILSGAQNSVATTFSPQVKPLLQRKDWWTPTKAIKISHGAYSLMRGHITCNERRQMTFRLNTGISLKSLCIPKVNTVPGGIQIKSLREVSFENWGFERTTEPSTDS